MALGAAVVEDAVDADVVVADVVAANALVGEPACGKGAVGFCAAVATVVSAARASMAKRFEGGRCIG